MDDFYEIMGTEPIAIKGDGSGTHEEIFLKTEVLGPQVMDMIKHHFFTPSLPGENLADYHSRIAGLVMKIPTVKELIDGNEPSISQKENRRDTQR